MVQQVSKPDPTQEPTAQASSSLPPEHGDIEKHGGRLQIEGASARPAIAVGSVLLVSSLVLAWAVRASENQALERHTGDVATGIAQTIETSLEQQLTALERFSSRWERSGEVQRDEWERAATDLIEDFAPIQAIEWVDEDLRVRWIVPLDGNEAALGLDLGFEAKRRESLEQARNERNVVVSTQVELVQGGKGFLAYAPMFPKGRFNGFSLAVYRSEFALASILQDRAVGFEISVFDKSESLYTRELADERPRASVRKEVGFRNLAWNVAVAPGTAVTAMYLTPLPWVLGASGGAIAISLAALTYVARSREARNLRLSREIQQRQELERELSILMDAIPVHIWSARAVAGRMEPTYFSPAIAEITGRPKAYFADHPERWLEAIHPDDRPLVAAAYERISRRNIQNNSVEYRIFRPNGEIRWLRESTRSTTLPDGRRFDGVIVDITDIKESEQERLDLEVEVMRSQKLESLGVLAGGVAHDFNNLLVGVLGNAELTRMGLPPDSSLRVHVDRISRAAQRAKDLCLQMLAYAGHGATSVEPLDLRATLEEMIELLASSLPKSVRIERAFEAEHALVLADPSQVRQVMLNLITNASEAIGNRSGTIGLSITTRSFDAREAAQLATVEPLEPGTYAILGIEDDGCGMDAEVRERFLEPFFSTKFSGRGLGLAATTGIVRAHKGAIRVSTSPGEGTRIEIFLPVLDPTSAASNAPRAASAAMPSGLAVLLVDDEEDVREVGQLLLSRADMRTLTAVDGDSAIQILDKHRDEINCVILDLTMPGRSPADTIVGLRAIRSDLPIVVCSGYPEASMMKQCAGLEVTGFLQKPYTLKRLVEAVRSALADGAAGEST